MMQVLKTSLLHCDAKKLRSFALTVQFLTFLRTFFSKQPIIQLASFENKNAYITDAVSVTEITFEQVW